MRIICEVTDTFGGEANYSWRRHKEFRMKDNASRRSIIRKAKQSLGINSRHTAVDDYGDAYTLRFSENIVVFINCDA